MGPWLALAGLGALHGLNPLCGWPLMIAGRAARGQILRGLLALAAGHAASLACVAAATLAGIGHGWLLSAALLLAAMGTHRHRAAMSLAFASTTLHGTGLMLVPALIPLCLADTPAREIVATGSWPLLLAALAVHLAAMLATAGALAALPFRRLIR